MGLKIAVTEQELEDIKSALDFTINNYDKESKQFLRALKKVLKRLWKVKTK